MAGTRKRSNNKQSRNNNNNNKNKSRNPQQPRMKPKSRGKVSKKPRGIRMSRDGEAFIKCAFASPDFAISGARGIPDRCAEKTIMRDTSTTTTVAPTADKDTFYLLLPTPGIAFWQTEVDIGTYPTSTSVFRPVYDKSFNATTGLFGAATDQSSTPLEDPIDRASVVTKFRYASNMIELTSVGPKMTTAGSITIWKGNPGLTLGVRQLAESNNVEYSLSGMDFVTSVPKAHYVGAIVDGAYTFAIDSEGSFPFHNIMSGVTRIPGVGSAPGTNSPTYGEYLGDIVGFGDLQAICVRVSVPQGGVASLVVDTKSCIEYQTNSNGILHEDASKSADYDPIALSAYVEVAQSLPVAVCRRENAGFWSDRVYPAVQRFLSGVKTAGQVASVTAGLLGMVI